MLPRLGKGEHVLKEWAYAEQKRGSNKDTATLTLTNRRLIHDVEGKRSITRHEIQLENIRSVDYKHETPSILGPVIGIIVGIVLLILGIVFLAVIAPGMADLIPLIVFLSVGGVLTVAGLCVTIVFFCKLGRGSFQMTVTVEGVESTGLEIGVSSIVASSKPKKSVDAKIKVNNDLAREIIDTLGAVIMECKLGLLEDAPKDEKSDEKEDGGEEKEPDKDGTASEEKEDRESEEASETEKAESDI